MPKRRNKAVIPPAAFDVEQAAQYCGVSTDTMYELLRQGQIEHFRINRRIIIPQAVLDQWLMVWAKRGGVVEI